MHSEIQMRLKVASDQSEARELILSKTADIAVWGDHKMTYLLLSDPGQYSRIIDHHGYLIAPLTHTVPGSDEEYPCYDDAVADMMILFRGVKCIQIVK